METIEDIRARFGNPYAGDASGPAQPINWSFRKPDAGLRMISVIVAILGVFVMLVGVWTFIVPLGAVGLGILAAALVIFIRAQYIAHHQQDFEVEDEDTAEARPDERAG